VDGVRRTAAELIAPARQDEPTEPTEPKEQIEPTSPTAAATPLPADSDARIDAARARLRANVAPRDGDGADER
jgi:hypothetical protein